MSKWARKVKKTLRWHTRLVLLPIAVVPFVPRGEDWCTYIGEMTVSASFLACP
jgi:hypothetical protein